MEMKVGVVLVLKGKSLKGKNRIHELGAKWEVIREGEVKTGTANQVIVLACGDKGGMSMRWLHLTDDPDFRIVKGEEGGNDSSGEAAE